VYAHRIFGSHSGFAERPRPPTAEQIAACAIDAATPHLARTITGVIPND
jgi:hypothetical protein